MSFHDHRDIIDSWPSRTVMAEDVGASYDTVKKWFQRNSIPAEYWLKVVRHAIKRDIAGVSFEVLDELKPPSGTRAESMRIAAE